MVTIYAQLQNHCFGASIDSFIDFPHVHTIWVALFLIVRLTPWHSFACRCGSLPALNSNLSTPAHFTSHVIRFSNAFMLICVVQITADSYFTTPWNNSNKMKSYSTFKFIYMSFKIKHYPKIHKLIDWFMDNIVRINYKVR